MALDCIDEFKVGCGCGSVNCGCNGRKVAVSDSRGDCVPLVGDPNEIFGPHTCAARGGTKTIKAPMYELTVENPPDDVERNPDGSPVIINGLVVAKGA